jgi:hypothetical protein
MQCKQTNSEAPCHQTTPQFCRHLMDGNLDWCDAKLQFSILNIFFWGSSLEHPFWHLKAFWLKGHGLRCLVLASWHNF